MSEEERKELDALIVRYKRGERELLELLVALLGGPMYSFLKARGIPFGELAGFISILIQTLFDTRIRKYNPRKEASFWSWLCVVMTNAAKDWHRARKRRMQIEVTDSEYIDRKAATTLLVEDVAPPSPRMKPILEAFDEAFARLGEEERDLLRPKVVGGLTYEQIAEQLQPGASPAEKKKLVGALRVRLHRAEGKIRDWMKADARVPGEFFDGKRVRIIK